MGSAIRLTCFVCGKIYNFPLKFYNLRKHRAPEAKDYCSQLCFHKSKFKKQKVNCSNCFEEFHKSAAQLKKTKRNFCSKSCAATFNNKHKIVGNRRSKLEISLELFISRKFPGLEIKYNEKSIIGSELDIYIPELKLAFELNGILHHKPIYGSRKLSSIQSNDTKKKEACLESGISLIVIDCFETFSEKVARKYFSIVENIITNKLRNRLTVELFVL